MDMNDPELGRKLIFNFSSVGNKSVTLKIQDVSNPEIKNVYKEQIVYIEVQEATINY